MGKKSDQPLGEKKNLSLWKAGSGAVNFLGILLAFGVAFGGMLVVRNRLAEEKKILLEEGGEIAIPVQDYEVEMQHGSEESQETLLLTEEELVQVVKELDRDAEAYPHEPLQGQLSMVQALEYGRSWLEEFFLPHLELEEDISREYKTSCHLWTLREGTDGSDAESLLLSYWTVTLSNPDLSASLILNAVTGQVLDASVCCYFPIDLWEWGSLMPLLVDYTDSFGVEAKYSSLIVDRDKQVYERDDWGMYQFLAGGEMFAVIQAGSFGVSSVTEDALIYVVQNIFSVHLYLAPRIDMD